MLIPSDTYWFPLRIRNSSASRQRKLKALLDEEEGVERTYIPMEFVKVNDIKMDFAPMVVNFIFVRTTLNQMRQIKADMVHYEPLRFIMHPVCDEKFQAHNEILTVPDWQMEDFIRVTAEPNEKVIFLDNLDYAFRPSQEVQITDGPYTGVIGRIKRIHGNKCVVLPLQGAMAVAILDVPRKFLRLLETETE